MPFFGSLADRIKVLGEIIGDGKYKALWLLVVLLACAIAEAFGLALIMPLLDVMMNGQAVGLWGKFIAIFITPYVPGDHLLLVIILFFLAMLVLKNGLIIYKSALSASFTQNLRRSWMNAINDNYLRASYTFILNNKHGDLLNNVIQEPNLAAGSVQNMVDFLSRTVLVAILLLVLLITNWQTTLFVSLVSGAIIFLTHKLRSEYAGRFGKERLALFQNLSSQVSENLGGARQIKTFELEGYLSGKFKEAVERLIKITIKFNIVKILPTCIGEVVIGGVVVLALVYLRYFMNYEMKEAIPIIGLFVIVAHRITQHLTQLVTQRMIIHSFIPSLLLVHDLSKMAPSHKRKLEGAAVKDLETDIEIKNLWFAYNKKPVFRDLSMTIPKGKMTAVVGPSGSGKSTLADLLIGLYVPQMGRIVINGCEMRDIDPRSWRRRIGFVSQDIFIFHTSIAENIALGKLGASKEEIIEAAKKAGAHEFIMQLAEGYDTVVGERGLKLSGGQRQRIAIARAIIRDPLFFIFDEATSALDSKTEKEVQKSIESLGKNNTVLIIAHRLSTIEDADVIYDLGTERNY